MNEYIKLAEYNDDKNGLVSEFIDINNNIIFAYTKCFNNKYTYELVSNEVNIELMEKYLKDAR